MEETENELHNFGTEPSRDTDQGLSQRKVRVLAATCLLQLPIWGMRSSSDKESCFSQVAGFIMSYGVFQDYYSTDLSLRGARSATGTVGTSANGVIYLMMPFLFTAFSKRWAAYRCVVVICGVFLTCASFLASSFSTQVWQIVATQGVLAALGGALIYSPTTLSLGETFNTTNRALAYGVVLSSKNIVGSTCPFLLRFLLDQYGYRTTMLIWTGITAASSLCALILNPAQTSTTDLRHIRPRQTPWHFLKHETIYVYCVAVMLQSCGYGLPQTYLTIYAHDAAALSPQSATLLLTLFNIPGIVSSAFFGYLTDNKRYPLSASTITCISAFSSALAVFLLWGLAPRSNLAVLALFSIIYGFFAGGYSGTWGSILKQMEREAGERNEAVDTGILYGLLNGARGIGYVSGGVVGVLLLKDGSSSKLSGPAGYGSEYGPMIIFTGLSTVFGGWSLMWKCKRLLR